MQTISASKLCKAWYHLISKNVNKQRNKRDLIPFSDVALRVVFLIVTFLHTNHILALPRFRIHLPIPNFIPTAIYLCNLTAHVEVLLIQMGFKWLHLPA